MIRRRTALVCAVLLFSGAAAAQPDRIVGRINPARTTVLTGNVHINALPEFDEGPADPAMKLNYVMLTLKTSAAQQAELEQLLRDQQDPFSPRFRKWLTPEQYADRFGASRADMNKIVVWLGSQGLEVITAARGRRWVAFNATVQQIQSAFHTEIRRYRVDGELHFANATAPSIPEALRGMVLGIDGLNDFRARHMAVQPLLDRLHPATTSGSGSHSLSPGDAWIIYNTYPLYQTGITGAGQKIAIIDRSDVLLSDISQFRSAFNLPANTIQRVLVPGSTNPGITSDNAETNLDLDWAGAIAPYAQLVYVFAPSEVTAVNYAIDQNLAPVISYSYYPCELNQSGSVAGNVQAIAQQANAQGITWIACSGDSGAESCDSNNYSGVAATHGLSVSLMAAIPEITGVGGTTFNEGNGRYWGTSANANAPTALGYIPEVAWTGSGGGYSIFYPKPDWQVGVPDTAQGPMRGVPDVSFNAIRATTVISSSTTARRSRSAAPRWERRCLPEWSRC
ncbi:MAG: hypothetical protein LAO79_19765 [Acidobacteriia bacterium]|nr:hypothetical protein [Terriglobia bacterium]